MATISPPRAPWGVIEFEVEHATAFLDSSHLPTAKRVWSVWVDDALRGHGHGRRLMQAITEWADENQVDLDLFVLVGNAVAIHLYESMGFEITNTFTDTFLRRTHYMFREASAR